MGTDHWRNKSEILNDLAEVTGVPINAKKRHLTTVTARPPAKVINSEELNELYSENFGSAPDHQNGFEEPVAPDLHNIKRMLDMLHEHDKLPDYNVPENTVLLSNVLVVSKLNPNVKEFKFEKGRIETPAVSNEDKESDHEVPKKLSKEDNNPDGNTLQTTIPNLSKKNLNYNTDHTDDIDVKVKVLKNKIITASKQQNLKGKFDRNVAISTLLKLHTTPVTDCKVDSALPKLLTPRDFELTATKIDERESHEEKDSQQKNVDKERKSPEDKDVNIKTNEDPQIDISAKEMEQSINKVENWLKPIKKEALMPYLKPIQFKRKQKPEQKSPETISTLQTTSSDSSNLSLTPRKFVPSQHAKELHQKYKERGEKNEKGNEDVWAKAQRQMKELDQKKRNEQI